MSTITTINDTDYQDDSRSVINTNFANLNSDKLEKSGDTMTGPLAFSGSTNSGIKVNNLTTTQRNALTPAAGMIIYNTTLACFEKYENGAWVPLSTAPSMTTTVRDSLTPVNGMSIYNTTTTTYQVYQAAAWVDFVTPKFGGDGSDGALTITSGTTTLDLGGAQTFVKNYSSISITGTGKLTFTNAHANGTTIVLKSRGNVTLTSSQAPMIDASGFGAAANTDGYGPTIIKTNLGLVTVGGGAGGVGGAVPSLSAANIVKSIFSGKYSFVVPGAGGGGGGTNTGGGGGGGSAINAGVTAGNGANTGSSGQGTGSAGGAVLIIECAGAWNFTTASGISVAGVAGGNATGGGNAGGGGGGGAGIFIGLYGTLTANTGTITVAGGTGGTKLGSGSDGGAGGAGYSLVAKNTEYV